MRIKITKGQVLDTQEIPATLFPAGEYLANLTPEGKIELMNTSKTKARFSFSQFREKLSLGEFVLLEA